MLNVETGATSLSGSGQPLTPPLALHEDGLPGYFHDALASGRGNEALTPATLEMREMTRLLLEEADAGIYGLDINGYCTFVNRAARELVGWSVEDMHGRTQHSLVHHSHADGSTYPLEDCPIYCSLKTGAVGRREGEVFWRKDGTSFPVAYSSTPLIVQGQRIGAVIIFADMTQRMRERDWERRKTRIFTSILSRECVEKPLTLIAESLQALRPEFSYALLAREEDHLHLRGEAGLPTPLRERILSVSLAEVTQACGKVVLLRENMSTARAHHGPDDHAGSLLEWSIPLRDPQREIIGTLSIFGNISPHDQLAFQGTAHEAADLARIAIEHSRLQTELKFQAQHDALTGLPNRLVLEDRLQQAIMAAKRHGTRLGVCYMDLDRFKQVNDTLGHGIGDLYLKHITDVLRANCREIDTLARQGGDEFILLLPDLESSQEASVVAARLLNALRTPFTLGEHRFTPSASVGISLYPEHDDTPVRLLQHADTALYAAKRAGRNQVCVFDPRLGWEVAQQNRLQLGLMDALNHGHLRLVYQPIYNVHRELQALEALLRWEDPVMGTIPPDQFIPVAEESGLISPIGAWVLHHACQQMMEWHRTGFQLPRLFVNVSGIQLDNDDFPAVVAAALEASGLPPSRLGLEITETWIISDPAAASARLRRLRALGVSISIDDFGTGQASFGSLHDLPLDTLKIDRVFIQRLDGSPKHLSTIRAMVMLAQQFGLRTVAEGVETEAQFEQLRELECDSIQGFLLAKPLEASAVHAMLEPTRSLPVEQEV